MTGTPHLMWLRSDRVQRAVLCVDRPVWTLLRFIIATFIRTRPICCRDPTLRFGPSCFPATDIHDIKQYGNIDTTVYPTLNSINGLYLRFLSTQSNSNSTRGVISNRPTSIAVGGQIKPLEKWDDVRSRQRGLKAAVAAILPLGGFGLVVVEPSQ